MQRIHPLQDTSQERSPRTRRFLAASAVLAGSASLLTLGGCLIAVDAGERDRDDHRHTWDRDQSGAAARADATGHTDHPAAPLSDPAPRAVDDSAPTFPFERFTLPNGMEVVLHQDRSLPKVVVNTWFKVGSKDEEEGRTGFAHLFEHLMFMGTGRVPDNQFDVIMETGGGWNNASTGNDRTNYFSEGPSSLLPTLLWLDADRLDSLDDYMTQAKLDSQRAVVRNERRQTSENVPYGKASLVIPELIYPIGHPYHHPVIGSHEDLEAATVEDVVNFFRRWYVPENASLVVSGDFDIEATRALIEQLFGAIGGEPLPPRTTPAAVTLHGVRSAQLSDDVEFPKLFLTWTSPAHFAPGDGEMDLVAAILAEGPSSRLVNKLVLEEGLAQDVEAAQYSGQLGSEFHIEVLPTRGVDLDTLKGAVLEVLEEFKREGPTVAELQRVKAQTKADFLRRAEDLGRRTDAMNSYLGAFGTPDGFGLDLARWTTPSREDVRTWAARVLGPDHVDLRVYPEGALPTNPLDTRPAPFPEPEFHAPAVESFTLSNGVRVHVISRPGSGLFGGYAWFEGGELLVDREQSGLSALLASLLESGSAGLDASEFAALVESLGAQVSASAQPGGMAVQVTGLSSELDEALDRFTEMIRRPNFDPEDFERERGLQLAEIAARADDPRALSTLTGMAMVFGEKDPRGRPMTGQAASVSELSLTDVKEAHRRLLHPGNTTLLFAGDLDPARLREALEQRFGSVPTSGAPVVNPSPKGAAERTGITIIDRPGAPQTMIYLLRPVPTLEGKERAVRECLLTIFGGTFTSRLNANLREDKNYTYGAGARSTVRGFQELLLARSAVFTDVTGAALSELKFEYDRLAQDGISPEELNKAVESTRTDLIRRAATTSNLARMLLGTVSARRPLDALARDLAALEDVTLEDCNRLAASGLFDWSTYAIVLVGDRSVIQPQLEAAGM